MKSDRERVVITGVGLLTPIANTRDDFWTNLVSGTSGAGPITHFDASELPSQIAAEVKNFDPTTHIAAKEARRMDRVTQYAVHCSYEALADAGLPVEGDLGDRFGVVIGSGIGGLSTFEEQHSTILERGPRRVSPFTIPMMIGDMAPGMVSIAHGARGPNYATMSACASAAHAIGSSIEHIRSGHADAMITGGTEAAVGLFGVAAFCSARALTTRNDEPERASRPFDADRDGFLIGEGCGVVIIESLAHAKARGAEIYAELLGYGYSGDAYHVTAPSPDGDGMARSMLAALRDAGVNPDDVDYINSHGTSTPAGDPAETAAVKSVFGDRARSVPMNSTKSMIGHLLGAAGAAELIATALSLKHGVLHPTINLDNPDPECDLDFVPHEAREQKTDVALSNSFGFGGHNATLVVRRWNE